MNPPRLVIFDMAGTTVEDDGQVPAAFTVALAAHGINVTPEQINRVRGASRRQAMLCFVPEGAGRCRLEGGGAVWCAWARSP